MENIIFDFRTFFDEKIHRRIPVYLLLQDRFPYHQNQVRIIGKIQNKNIFLVPLDPRSRPLPVIPNPPICNRPNDSNEPIDHCADDYDYVQVSFSTGLIYYLINNEL